MATLRTAVILCLRPNANPASVKSQGWYTRYFFGVSNSQAAYWMEQTRGQLTFAGEVIDWLPYSEDLYRKKDQDGYKHLRRDILEVATARAFPRDEDFNRFDRFVVILALSPGEPCDAGSGPFERGGNWYSGLVAFAQTDSTPGHAFDYTAHELGHQLGLGHSWGLSRYWTGMPWDPHGEYGHPYCVMSAQSYGGTNPTFTPNPVPDNAIAQTRIPPRLNAAMCVAKNFMAAYKYDLEQNPGATTVRIYARDLWFARNDNRLQALRVTALDGKSYVFEYRRASGLYDRGLHADTVMLSALAGSKGGDAGTFMQAEALPWKSPHSGLFEDSLDFAVELLEWSPDSESVLLHVSPNKATRLFRFSLTELSKEILESQEVASGIHDFVQGEEKCVRGPYPWVQRHIYLREKLRFTYQSPIAVTPKWSIRGVPLDSAGGVLELSRHECWLPQPVPHGIRTRRKITVRYAFEGGPNQSVLILENNPEDGGFELLVSVSADLGLGVYSEAITILINGAELTFGNGFDEARFACIFIPHDDRFHLKSPILPSNIWDKIPRPERPAVSRLLRALASHVDSDVIAADEIERALAKYLKIDAVPMMWVDHTRAENIVATEHDVNESNIAFRQR